MEIFKVGGAVRDSLLGRTPQDIDYVVVGSTPEEMISLGYVQVGASFPVFLKNGEEYALARTERKTGVGYNGFDVVYDPDVTLEDDLIRRDLTINSMAMSLDDSTIYDPHGGMNDLRDGILRHTSEAFAEDPVRVLRTARFAARYGYTVHPDTMELMRKVCGELIHVPMERVWTEIEKGLSEQHWVTMFDVMDQAAVFTLPCPFRCLVQYKWHHKFWIHHNSEDGYQLSPVDKFALISHGFMDDDFKALTVPTEFSRFSKIFNATASEAQQFGALSARERIYLFEGMRVFNEWDGVARQLIKLHSRPKDTKFDVNQFVELASKARAVDTAAIASMYTSGLDIKKAIFEARVKAISDLVSINT